MDLNQIAAVCLAMIAAGALAYVFIYPYLSGDIRAEKRQQALVSSSARVGERTTTSAASRREQVANSLKEIDAREKAKNKANLETRIAQAGLTLSKTKFMIFSISFGLVLGFFVLALSGNPIAAATCIFIGAVGAPFWLLGYLKKRRIKRFLNEFPNAIDIIVRGIRSGLPIGDCLRIIANESAEPVRSEFRYIVEQQALGISVADATAKLAQRVPVTESNFFGIVIAIQQKSGGNLSEILSNLSKILRERKKMKGKIAAMSMEAKASAAIIAALPFVVATFVWFTSPRYIELMWTKEAGKLALMGSAFWMFIGIMAMKKMIAFDF
jgi:tight adherence protein B